MACPRPLGWAGGEVRRVPGPCLPCCSSSCVLSGGGVVGKRGSLWPRFWPGGVQYKLSWAGSHGASQRREGMPYAGQRAITSIVSCHSHRPRGSRPHFRDEQTKLTEEGVAAAPTARTLT